MTKRPSSSPNAGSSTPPGPDTNRLFRALQRDALARGVHPREVTKQRAAAAYEGIVNSVPRITGVTAEVMRDEGIELRIRTAKALGIVAIDPNDEPLFEVTSLVGEDYGEDVTFSDLSEAIGYLAAQLR